MRGQRNPFVAQEGLPFLALVAALIAYLIRYHDPLWALLPAVVFVLLFLLFRDPRRDVPSVALGVVSPVDGKVVAVETLERGILEGGAYRVLIRINALGTYTARSPVEGFIMDLHSEADGVGPDCPAHAMWVKTDEGASVILRFLDYSLGFPPKSFVRMGERIGQGSRCAYIRLARYAEVYVPIAGKVYVKPGQTVVAGDDLIGAVPHP